MVDVLGYFASVSLKIIFETILLLGSDSDESVAEVDKRAMKMDHVPPYARRISTGM